MFDSKKIDRWPLQVMRRFIIMLGLKEPLNGPDNDGLYNGLISPRDQCDYMWKLSWMCLLSAIVSAGHGHFHLAPVPFGGFITSLIYWQKADYSWRRTMDITYMSCALSYQVWHAVGAEFMIPYYVLTSFGLVCYGLGWYFHKEGSTWGGTIAHSGVHIFANIANIVLYSGAVEKNPQGFAPLFGIIEQDFRGFHLSNE